MNPLSHARKPGTPKRDWRKPMDRRRKKNTIRERAARPLPVLMRIDMPNISAISERNTPAAKAYLNFFITIAQSRGIEAKNMGQVLRELKNTPPQVRAFFRAWVRLQYPHMHVEKTLLEEATQRFMREQYAPDMHAKRLKSHGA